jgi:hypothetical protein
VAISAGISDGTFEDVDVDIMVFDIMLVAHGWALKHWHFGALYSLEEYIRLQTRYVLSSLISCDRRGRYADLLE